MNFKLNHNENLKTKIQGVSKKWAKHCGDVTSKFPRRMYGRNASSEKFKDSFPLSQGDELVNVVP